MKKALAVLLLVAALCAATALLAGTARASTSCDTGIEAGFFHQGVPGVGAVLKLNIDATQSILVTAGSSFRSYMAVTNIGGDSLQVGEISDGHGLQKYVEYDGSFLHKVDAAKNVTYHPTITKTATGSWTATMDGLSWTRSVPTASSVNYFTVDRQIFGQQCNVATFHYDSLSPWLTSQMTESPGDTNGNGNARVTGYNDVAFTTQIGP